MKQLTKDEKVAKAAKLLVKAYRASDDKSLVKVTGRFWDQTSNRFGGVHRVFRLGDDEIDFGELGEVEYGQLTCRLADAVCAKLKTKKGDIVYREEVELSKWHGGVFGWDERYTVCRKVRVIRPCKAFHAVNKKLKALGLKELFFRDWYYCEVAGKRSEVFSRQYRWYAEDEAKCKKVLDYLKGKKKASYDYVKSDDLEDRSRGEEYETEWYGSESRQLRFTDAKGKSTIIY